MQLLKTLNITDFPSFADLREKLFVSDSQLLGNRWHCASDRKIDWYLFLTMILIPMSYFSVYPIINFFVQTFLLTSTSLCMLNDLFDRQV